jgi:hypothetical protein
MPRVNLDILRNLSDKSFIRELRSSPANLTLQDSPLFFQSILGHFRKSISTARGNLILGTLAKILQQGKYAHSFLTSGSVDSLPITTPTFCLPVFDIFMILVLEEPQSIDAKFVAQFIRQIPLDPIRALTVLAKYSTHFQDLDSPWDLLDVLFKHSDQIAVPDTAIEYPSLLLSLCRDFPEFLEYRGKSSWLKICQLLDYNLDFESMKAIYGSLFALSSILEVPVVPVKQILVHLQNPRLHGLIFPLLLVCAPQVQDDELILCLLREAQADAGANLVLMALCEVESNAALIAGNDAWVDNPLPTDLDTLKLVYVVVQHCLLASALAHSHRLVVLIGRCLETKQVEALCLIAGIVKRLDFARRDLAFWAKASVFEQLLAASDHCDSEEADKAVFEFFTIVCRFGFTKELIDACSIALNEVGHNGTFAREAAQLLLASCQFRACREALRRANGRQILVGQRATPLRGIAARILKLLDSDEQGSKQ